jgi:hypothetical protein
MEWPRPASAEARDDPLVPVNLGAPGRHLRAVAVMITGVAGDGRQREMIMVDRRTFTMSV